MRARAAALVVTVTAFAAVVHGAAENGPRAAVLDLGDAVARRAVASALRTVGIAVLDDGLTDAAVHGCRYASGLNPTLDEARRLGQAVGAAALVMGTVSVAERQSDNASVVYDAFVGLFLVDARSGKLVRYKGFRATAPDRSAALERALVDVGGEVAGWGEVCRRAAAGGESAALAPEWDPTAVDFVANPDGGAGLIPPRFFKRPSPSFTSDADRAHAIATVDLLVQFNADGSYGPIEAVRWAGFGLEEAASDAVCASRFWPARSDGKPVTARALLRYNFRFSER